MVRHPKNLRLRADFTRRDRRRQPRPSHPRRKPARADRLRFRSTVVRLHCTRLHNRGDFGKIRKNGGGARAIASLSLEPRGTALNDKDV